MSEKASPYSRFATPQEPQLAGGGPLSTDRLLGAVAGSEYGESVGRPLGLLDPQSGFATRLALAGARYGAADLDLAYLSQPDAGTWSLDDIPVIPISQARYRQRDAAVYVLPTESPVEALDLWRAPERLVTLAAAVPALRFVAESRLQCALLREAFRLAGIAVLPATALRAGVAEDSAALVGYVIQLQAVSPMLDLAGGAPATRQERDAFECLLAHCQGLTSPHEHRVGRSTRDGFLQLTGDIVLDPSTGDVFERRPDPFAPLLGDPAAEVVTLVGRARHMTIVPPAVDATLIQRLYWAQGVCADLECS